MSKRPWLIPVLVVLALVMGWYFGWIPLPA